MAKLEHLIPGSNVIGLAGREPITIIAVKWCDTNFGDSSSSDNKRE